MSLATIWAEVEADAKAAVLAVEGGVEKLAAEIGPVIVAEVEATLKELCQIAIGAVIAEAPKVISGAEKFGNAVATVVQTAEAQGKSVVVANAQMAVQGAFTAIQAAVNPAS